MFNWEISPTQIQWILSLGVIIATFAAVRLARALLRKVGHSGGWALIHPLAPSISSIIYVVGIRAFTEVTPLTGRVEVWLEHAAYILEVLIFLNLARHAALVAIEWTALRAHGSKTLQYGFIPLMRNVISLFVFLAGAIMLLKHFNYDVLSLVTALGVGSLAVGLAAKDTLSHMISGFTLIIDRNLKPGDRINLSGVLGDVEEIGLRSTRIRIGDGNTLIVPNSELANTKILNLSDPSREVTCTSTIRVPYNVSFSKVRTIGLNVLKQVDKANQNKKTWVHLDSLDKGHQTVTLGFWLEDLEHVAEALTQLNEKLLAALTAEKIELAKNPPATTP